jgi:hypothetical protein
MFRTFLLATALGAIALPAAAGTSITVSVAGLDATAAHAAIYHAAQAACRAEMRDETDLVQFYDRPQCISEAITRAEANMAAAGTTTHFASR